MDSQPYSIDSTDSTDGVFEIVDFTNASPLEVFINELERVLKKWKVGQVAECGVADHEILIENVFFESTEVQVSLHSLPHHLLAFALPLIDSLDDSTVAFHPLHRLASQDRLVVLRPCGTLSLLIQPSLLLSCVAIAIDSVKCTIPVFVPIAGFADIFEGLGIDQNGDFNHWKMRASRGVPQNCGIIQLGAQMCRDESYINEYNSETPIPMVALADTYRISTLSDNNWRFIEPSSPLLNPVIPVGPLNTPLVAMTITVHFPQIPLDKLNKDPFLQSNSANELPHKNLLKASWALSPTFNSAVHDPTLLSTALATLFNTVFSPVLDSELPLILPSQSHSPLPQPQFHSQQQTQSQPHSYSEDEAMDNSGPGDYVKISSIVGRDLRKASTTITEKVGSVIVHAVSGVSAIGSTADSVHERDVSSACAVIFKSSLSDADLPLDLVSLIAATLEKSARSSPIAPFNSLEWRLANIVLHTSSPKNTLHFRPSLHAYVKALWRAFAANVHRIWDRKDELLPDTACDVDLRFSLLQQKLQMLNYCLARIQREKMNSLHDTASTSVAVAIKEPSSDSEDEFFEALEDSNQELKRAQGLEPGDTDAGAASSLAVMEETKESQHEGRSKLLNATGLVDGEPLWIPVTQESGVMTLDQILEMRAMFVSLGEGKDAARARAKLQSSQLFSDMESFKAANPNATLEDFVQWHSPKDWVIDESAPSGKLSQRMTDSAGNLWHELWDTARRIPAIRQKKLFDSEMEAEKVLSWLGNLTVKDVLTELVPTITFLAWSALRCHSLVTNPSLGALQRDIEDVLKNVVRCSRDDLNLEIAKNLVQRVQQSELLLGKAMALLNRLPGEFSTVDRLLNSPKSTMLTVLPPKSLSSADNPVLYLIEDEETFYTEYTFTTKSKRVHIVSRDGEFKTIEKSKSSGRFL